MILSSLKYCLPLKSSELPHPLKKVICFVFERSPGRRRPCNRITVVYGECDVPSYLMVKHWAVEIRRGRTIKLEDEYHLGGKSDAVKKTVGL